MKKVIALTLVLAVSAFADVVDIQILGPGTMEVGDTGQFQIAITADHATPIVAGNLLFDVTGDDVLSITEDLEWTYSDDEMVFGDNSPFGFTPTPSTVLGLNELYLSFYGPGVAVQDQTILFTYYIEAVAEGEINIGMAPHKVPNGMNQITTLINEGGTEYGGVTSALTVNVIPEPASLALLAIGGLAVIRRR